MRSVWSKQVGILDWLATGVAAVLVLLTVSVASSPVATSDEESWLLTLWPLAAIVWAVPIVLATEDRVARAAAALLLIAAILMFGMLGVPLFLLLALADFLDSAPLWRSPPHFLQSCSRGRNGDGLPG